MRFIIEIDWCNFFRVEREYFSLFIGLWSIHYWRGIVYLKNKNPHSFGGGYIDMNERTWVESASEKYSDCIYQPLFRGVNILKIFDSQLIWYNDSMHSEKKNIRLIRNDTRHHTKPTMKIERTNNKKTQKKINQKWQRDNAISVLK